MTGPIETTVTGNLPTVAMEPAGPITGFNIVHLAQTFQVGPAPSREQLTAVVARYMKRHQHRHAGMVLDETTLFSFAAHTFTDYERVLAQCQREIGMTGPYLTLKVHLCSRIIQHCGLHLHPLTAAFGSAYPAAATADNARGGGDANDGNAPIAGAATITGITGPDLMQQLFDPGQSAAQIEAITAWMLATGASEARCHQ